MDRETAAVKFIEIADPFDIGGVIDRRHRKFKRDAPLCTNPFGNVKHAFSLLKRYRHGR